LVDRFRIGATPARGGGVVEPAPVALSFSFAPVVVVAIRLLVPL
jgi:hypothetical protein